MHFAFASQNDVDEKVKTLFAKRVDHITLKIDTIATNELIQILKSQTSLEPYNAFAFEYYLAIRNFKARFVILNENRKKKYLQENIQLARLCMQKFPRSGRILFEAITCIGLQAEINGVIKNVYNGVVEEMNKLSSKLIQCDSMYYNGGGWKIQSVLNYSVPKIPGIISWPNKESALAMMKKTVGYFPNDVGANFYYAEALWNSDQKMLAKGFFKRCCDLPLRKLYPLEDLYFKQQSLKYLN